MEGDAAIRQDDATSELPEDFWPSIDAWYWGGSCYVCQLASELVGLRIERYRVHRLVSGLADQQLEGISEAVLNQWHDAICDDVTKLLIAASAELGGSFLKDLASVLTGDHPRLRSHVESRDIILDWLVAFLHEPEHHCADTGHEKPHRKWLLRYRDALQKSTRAACSRVWRRHILPMHRSFMGTSHGRVPDSECPCSDASLTVYHQLEQSRIWMSALVNPSAGSWGMCEHLTSIIDGMRVLLPLLPPNAANNDQVLRASCAIAQTFARQPAVWKGFVGLRMQPPSDEQWFGYGAVEIADADCFKLAAELESELRLAVQRARGIVSSSYGPLHGKDVCPWLSSVPLATQSLRTTVSTAFWYFANEGLVESMGDDSAQYRVVVPFQRGAIYGFNDSGHEDSMYTYIGPWRSTHAMAIRDRKSLHAAFTLLRRNASRLLSLLEIVDDSLVFYRDIGVSDRDHGIHGAFGSPSMRAGGSPPAQDDSAATEDAPFADIQEVLQQQDTKWEQDMFESLKRRAAANVLAEMEALQLPFPALCSKLEENTIRLRWIGRAVLLRWCRPHEPIVERCSQQEPNVDSSTCPEVVCQCGEDTNVEDATTTSAPELLNVSVGRSAEEVLVQNLFERQQMLFVCLAVFFGISGWIFAAAMELSRLRLHSSPASPQTLHGGTDGPVVLPQITMLPIVDLPGILAMAHRERILAAAQARPMSSAAPAA